MVAEIAQTVIVAMLSAGAGGMITGAAAVAAVRVEIKWLTTTATDTRNSVTRAHERIDHIEDKMIDAGQAASESFHR
mgnify:CR=1 FL=1